MKYQYFQKVNAFTYCLVSANSSNAMPDRIVVRSTLELQIVLRVSRSINSLLALTWKTRFLEIFLSSSESSYNLCPRTTAMFPSIDMQRDILEFLCHPNGIAAFHYGVAAMQKIAFSTGEVSVPLSIWHPVGYLYFWAREKSIKYALSFYLRVRRVHLIMQNCRKCSQCCVDPVFDSTVSCQCS